MAFAVDFRTGGCAALPRPRSKSTLDAVRALARRIQRRAVHDRWSCHRGGRAACIPTGRFVANCVGRSGRLRAPSAARVLGGCIRASRNTISGSSSTPTSGDVIARGVSVGGLGVGSVRAAARSRRGGPAVRLRNADVRELRGDDRSARPRPCAYHGADTALAADPARLPTVFLGARIGCRGRDAHLVAGGPLRRVRCRLSAACRSAPSRHCGACGHRSVGHTDRALDLVGVPRRPRRVLPTRASPGWRR